MRAVRVAEVAPPVSSGWIKNVWGAQAADGCGILRVNIANLRKKIEQDSGNPLYLFTENGVGYKIAESTPENADFAAKSG